MTRAEISARDGFIPKIRFSPLKAHKINGFFNKNDHIHPKSCKKRKNRTKVLMFSQKSKKRAHKSLTKNSTEK